MTQPPKELTEQLELFPPRLEIRAAVKSGVPVVSAHVRKR